MKKLLLTISSAVLIGLACPAQAAPIEGILQLYGNVEVEPAAQTIEFYPGISLVTQPYQVSGSFSALSLPSLFMAWQNMGTDLPYSALGTGSNLACGPTCMMAFADPTHVGWLNLTSPVNVLANTDTHVVLAGAGIMSMTGFDPTPGIWAMDIVPLSGAPYGYWPQFGFIANDPAPVPGPAVGAGVPGLIAACGGLLALARRRRLAASA